VSLFYGVFVVGTIGAFLCYIGLDLKARWKGRLPWRRHPAGDPSIKSEAEFERMTLNLRIQHIVMIISFFLLVLTGLPLKYPDAWASAKIIGLLGGFTLRAVIHRIAAVMLIGLAAYHVIYSISSRNGRSELRAFVPKVKDVHDAIGTIKFYLGFSKDMPKFDRYNFIEKFEYFAVGWGSVVMIATGFALWFQTKALLVLPLWLLDVARVVHSYEALLAFLTIIIWHFYHVHFNPSVFPMSKIWLNGRITEHEMKELHPIEYERLMKRREERQERSKDQ
jgi:cytochrome b subunit of formate dehydrogenase